MTLSLASRFRNNEGAGLLSVMLVILSVSLAAAVILAVVAPGLMSRNSRETNAKADRILSALNRYATDNSGTYPPDLLSLVDGDPGTCNLVNDPGDPNYSTLQGWCGPYLFRDFLEFPDGFQTDAWGTLFGYSGGVSLQSAGPDREWGTGDDLSF